MEFGKNVHSLFSNFYNFDLSATFLQCRVILETLQKMWDASTKVVQWLGKVCEKLLTWLNNILIQNKGKCIFSHIPLVINTIHLRQPQHNRSGFFYASCDYALVILKDQTLQKSSEYECNTQNFYVKRLPPTVKSSNV